MAINVGRLMSGVGVIIDDALDPKSEDTNNDIFKIIKQINNKNIPYCTYYKLPNINYINHFRGVSFILLDWDLTDKSETDTEQGVKMPDTLDRSNIELNIEFLKKIQSTCFVPVFIFSAYNTDTIINELEEANIYNSTKPNFILIKSKSEIKGSGQLFSAIETWLKETPSIYVLKEWESVYYEAKNKLFWNFFEISPEWPKVLWQAFKDDSVNMSLELGELITRNIHSRARSFKFETSILEADINSVLKKDIIHVMEGERFIKAEQLNKNEINTGDIFKEAVGDGIEHKYWLNIRPQCDLVPRGENKIGSIKLYLIEGEVIDYPNTKTQFKNIFNESGGNFKEQVSDAILFPVDGKIIKFSFKEHQIKSFGGLKSKRIGKLLPPYITRVQQRYALYLHREGMPRTPVQAVYNNGGSRD